MQWHQTPKGLMCQICDLKLPNEEEHRKHLQLHDEKLKHQCVLCDRKYKNSTFLKIHVKTHVS